MCFLLLFLCPSETNSQSSQYFVEVNTLRYGINQGILRRRHYDNDCHELQASKTKREDQP